MKKLILITFCALFALISNGQTFDYQVKGWQLQVDTTYDKGDIPEETGSRYWDKEDKTSSLVLPNGVILQDGHALFYDVINQSGDTLNSGHVAAYAGSIGTSDKMQAIHGIANYLLMPPHYILGIVNKDILNGEQGKVTYFGKVRGIQTNGANFGETWSDGDLLYVSKDVTGYMTKVKPDAPYPDIPIAVVVNASATNGILSVRPTFPTRLQDLADVGSTTLDSTGQIPVWNNTTKVFDFTSNVNSFTGGGGGYTLPTATSTILGGVKIGSGVSISGGSISVSTNYEAPLGNPLTNGQVLSSTTAGARSWVSKIGLTDLSAGGSGISYDNTTGQFYVTSGYSIPTTAQKNNFITAYGWGDHAGLYTPLAHKTTEDALNGLVKVNGAGVYSAITDNSTNWNTAYTNRIATFTTTGNSGAATFSGNTLNIPTYTLAGLGGIGDAPSNGSIYGRLNGAWSVISTSGTGTVTSVAMTTPTGLTVTGSPITTSGTLALTLTSGYVIPTTTNQTNWNNAFAYLGKPNIGGGLDFGYLSSSYFSLDGSGFVVPGISPTPTSGELLPLSSGGAYTALAGKQNNITLTTTGTSGAATLVGSTLNIPDYTGGGISYWDYSYGLIFPTVGTDKVLIGGAADVGIYNFQVAGNIYGICTDNTYSAGVLTNNGSTGNALQLSTIGGTTSLNIMHPSANNTATVINTYRRTTSNGSNGANNIGLAHSYELESSGGAFILSGYMKHQLSDATAGSEDGNFSWWLTAGGSSPSEVMSLSSLGDLTLDKEITSTGGKIGYTGTLSSVTQLTSKATGVTLNNLTGQITTFSAALAAADEATFVVTNSFVTANDVIIVNHKSGGTSGSYLVTVSAVAAGSFSITYSNCSTSSRTEQPVFSFAVIKGN